MPADAHVDDTTPTASSRSVRTAQPEDIAQFKEWLIAKSRVHRRNRNLLQYAAGLAALLGIGGATSGVFALADSLAGSPSQSPTYLRFEYGALVVGSVLALVLTALIIKSLTGRRRAEWEADERLRHLPDGLLSPHDLFGEAADQ